jgi:hypothetical protein
MVMINITIAIDPAYPIDKYSIPCLKAYKLSVRVKIPGPPEVKT